MEVDELLLKITFHCRHELHVEQTQPEVRRLLGEEERVVVEEVDKQNEVVEDSKVVQKEKGVVGKEGREGRSEEGGERWGSRGNVDLVSFHVDVDVYRSAVFWSIF